MCLPHISLHMRVVKLAMLCVGFVPHSDVVIIHVTTLPFSEYRARGFRVMFLWHNFSHKSKSKIGNIIQIVFYIIFPFDIIIMHILAIACIFRILTTLLTIIRYKLFINSQFVNVACKCSVTKYGGSFSLSKEF